jgi:hypothetical protein
MDFKYPGQLFDDSGFFRGMKRSLHEGGIRQTIVVSAASVLPLWEGGHSFLSRMIASKGSLA